MIHAHACTVLSLAVLRGTRAVKRRQQKARRRRRVATHVSRAFQKRRGKLLLINISHALFVVRTILFPDVSELTQFVRM